MPKSPSRSHLRYPLDGILGNVGKVRVLRVIYEWPSAVSVRQIAVETGMTPQGVRVVLDALSSDGLLDVLGDARTQLYARKESHPWTTPLADLFQTERRLWEAVIARIRAVLDSEDRVKAAWIYGSVARGVDRPESDIDLAVLMEPGMDPLPALTALADVEGDLQVSISPIFVSEPELAGGKVENRWWQEVLRDGEQLKGSPRHLAGGKS